MALPRYLSAAEAARALGVRPATLYAYVSRGQIRSETGPDKRARRYYAEDIERLAARKAQRRDPSRVASGALHAGRPVRASQTIRVWIQTLPSAWWIGSCGQSCIARIQSKASWMSSQSSRQ